MDIDLRISEEHWSRLRRHLSSSFRSRMAPETGALAILGECATPTKQEYVVAKVLLPGPTDLKTASSGEVVFDASFLRRAHLEMRKSGLAGIATFHTHPFADSSVSFSGYDDQQDPLLAENLIELEPRTKFVSVVAGKTSQCGRLFTEPRVSKQLQRLVVVGERLTYLPLDGRPPFPPPKPQEIFDRGKALTGSGALGLLSRMTVVVVGASGTGSLMCELLARAGCRRILVIDHDIVKLINLNRMLHATMEDAKVGRPKVEVLRRAIEALGLGCSVEPIFGSILDRDVLRRVLDADLIFGCVDRDTPRYLLSEIAYRYLLPYVDVGSEIGGDEDGIVSLDSRVSYVAPGRHCLMCTGVVTPRRLRFESLSAAERQREIALGYSDDLLIEQPAVMDLNMRAASNGMLLLRHLLQPFMREPYPVKLSENAVTYRMIGVSAAAKANPACPTCRANQRFGYGDIGPAIGFDPHTAARIVGETPSAATRNDSRWLRAPHFLTNAVRRLFGKTA